MRSIYDDMKVNCPETHCELVYSYIADPGDKPELDEEDRITNIIIEIEERLDPVTEKMREIRKSMKDALGRFEI